LIIDGTIDGYIREALLGAATFLMWERRIERDRSREFLMYPNERVRNPWRHVGRNDPCPCGSGKKAKKCRLANGEPPA